MSNVCLQAVSPEKQSPQWLAWFACAVLWGGLAGAVYLGLPQFRRILEDHGAQHGALLGLTFESAWFVLPLIGIAAGLAWAVNTSLRIKSFALGGVPLIGMAILLVATVPTMIRLLHELQKRVRCVLG